MWLVVTYIPDEHVNPVISAMSNAGAGAIGEYRACAFKQQGIGQFKPTPEANPFIGEADKLEQVSETRVEMVCNLEMIKDVLVALIDAHPYEEPAYHAIEVKTLADFN